MRRFQRIFFILLLSCVCGVSINGFAVEAEITAWLAAHGFDVDHELLLSWTERAPGEDDRFVHGCRLAPPDSDAFDVYFSEDGILLDAQALTRLGIYPKQWHYADVNVPAIKPRPTAATHVALDTAARSAARRAPRHRLEMLNHAPLLEEDAASGSDAAVIRYGVNRRLDPPITLSDGAWTQGAFTEQPDGQWQWSVTLSSPPAFGIRLFLERLAMPDTVSVFVVNPDYPQEYFGPIGAGDAQWTPTIHGDSVAIICQGAGRDALAATVVRIPDIIHVYRSPESLEEKLGACHIHAACAPDWLGAASAVGRLGYVHHDAWACTGALIVAPFYVEQGRKPPPFLLTANHCVNNQLQANSLEVWWFYEHDQCEDGTPPDPALLPRSTGGARFLVGSSPNTGTDMSFLLLNQSPPVATAYLGFATRLVVPGEAVVGIHHPGGETKRISFGDVSDNGSPGADGQPLAPYSHFHEVLWRDGSTERGSSGSPLLLGDTAQIIGHLFGGYASCDAMDEPDYYGRFDVGFPLLKPWLYGEQDPYEGEAEPTEGETPREGEEPGEGEDGEGEGETPKEGEDGPQGCRELLGLSKRNGLRALGVAPLLPAFAVAALGFLLRGINMG